MRFIVKGQVVAESTHTSVRRDAERILAKRRAEVVQEVVLAGKKPIKLHDALDLFIKSRSHLPSHQGCEIHLRYFREAPDHYLDRITDADLQKVLQDKRDEGYAESTLKVSVSYFNAMIAHVGDMGYTVRKKMKRIKHDSGRLRWLTKDEYAALVAVLDPQLVNDPILKAQRQENFDLVKLLYETGCRYKEISAMRWNQVDLKKGTVFIKRLKGSVDGTLFMTATMKEVFARRRAMDKGDLVFGSKEGRDNEGAWVRKAVGRAKLNQSEGKVVLHTLRHSRAVHLLQAGMNLVEVQKFLGHKTIQSTMQYVHVIEDDVMRKAVRLTDGEQEPALQAEPNPATQALRLVV
ncbi:site-specific integrase [Hydrogenophaga sp. IBVHS1]|uniref:tyrosine-type recombinase/integrase n=1 Tax=unclassified Hydrogenophaga TaxID=2610897 RepID=UPI0015C500B2|nr:site-specific integrase [Hydrogenophaga sp. IBVHS1]